jgi:hypothetical protein
MKQFVFVFESVLELEMFVNWQMHCVNYIQLSY